MTDTAIAERLGGVRERVERAAVRAGRDAGDVLLIAVSKTQSDQAVRQAYEAGQRDFGENYVQEMVAKATALRDLPGLRWHMIGHLQTNKVKQVVGVAGVVHTVDRVSLAQELGKRVEGELDVLVEVNVGGEESKTGAAMNEAESVVEAVRGQARLRLRGLMTVPPFDLDLAEVAVHFARLREMAAGYGLRELSMGMSHDFEEAIAHGATMVRVGTAIFGARG
jgi:pyridoxal phosphate enzyme (YggS family)